MLYRGPHQQSFTALATALTLHSEGCDSSGRALREDEETHSLEGHQLNLGTNFEFGRGNGSKANVG